MSMWKKQMMNVCAIAERMGNVAYAAEMRKWHREERRFQKSVVFGQADIIDHYDHWIESVFATSHAQSVCDWVTGQWLGAWLVGIYGGTVHEWTNLFCDLIDEASDNGEVLDTFDALMAMID